MKSPEDFARLLYRKACQEALVVRKVVDDEEISDEALGFHIEQALEKSLKAILSLRGIHFRRTHDIRELLDLLSDNEIELPEAFEHLDEWTPYAVEYRYEDTEIQETGFDRSAAVKILDDVLSWVDNDLNAPHSPDNRP